MSKFRSISTCNSTRYPRGFRHTSLKISSSHRSLPIFKKHRRITVTVTTMFRRSSGSASTRSKLAWSSKLWKRATSHREWRNRARQLLDRANRRTTLGTCISSRVHRRDRTTNLPWARRAIHSARTVIRTPCRVPTWWTTKFRICRINSIRPKVLRRATSLHSSHTRRDCRVRVLRATVKRLWITFKNLKLIYRMDLIVKWLMSSNIHWQTWEVLIHSTTVAEADLKIASTSSNNWFSPQTIQSLSKSHHRARELKLWLSSQVHMLVVKSRKQVTIVMEVARTMDPQLPTWLEKALVNRTRRRMSRWRAETLSNAQQTRPTGSSTLTTTNQMVPLETIWSKMESKACSNKCFKQMANRFKQRTTVRWRGTNKDKSMDSLHRITSTCLTPTRSVRQWACLSLETTYTKPWEVVLEEATQALRTVQLHLTTLIIQAFWRSTTMTLTKWTTALQCTITIITFTKRPT